MLIYNNKDKFNNKLCRTPSGSESNQRKRNPTCRIQTESEYQSSLKPSKPWLTFTKRGKVTCCLGSDSLKVVDLVEYNTKLKPGFAFLSSFVSLWLGKCLTDILFDQLDLTKSCCCQIVAVSKISERSYYVLHSCGNETTVPAIK